MSIYFYGISVFEWYQSFYELRMIWFISKISTNLNLVVLILILLVLFICYNIYSFNK
jgi:hypothetical protein